MLAPTASGELTIVICTGHGPATVTLTSDGKLAPAKPKPADRGLCAYASVGGVALSEPVSAPSALALTFAELAFAPTHDLVRAFVRESRRHLRARTSIPQLIGRERRPFAYRADAAGPWRASAAARTCSARAYRHVPCVSPRPRGYSARPRAIRFVCTLISDTSRLWLPWHRADAPRARARRDKAGGGPAAARDGGAEDVAAAPDEGGRKAQESESRQGCNDAGCTAEACACKVAQRFGQRRDPCRSHAAYLRHRRQSCGADGDCHRHDAAAKKNRCSPSATSCAKAQAYR